MEPMKIKLDDFRLDNFINFYEDNVYELVSDILDFKRGIELVDKDYLDVLNYDDDYDNFECGDDYKQALLDEEYSLHFVVCKTHEGNEKIEFIDGKKYPLMHFMDDLYGEEDPIKDIGELSLDFDHFVGLLFDVEDDELEISIVNYRHGSGVGKQSIEVIEDSGDMEDVIKAFIGKFKY